MSDGRDVDLSNIGFKPDLVIGRRPADEDSHSQESIQKAVYQRGVRRDILWTLQWDPALGKNPGLRWFPLHPLNPRSRCRPQRVLRKQGFAEGRRRTLSPSANLRDRG